MLSILINFYVGVLFSFASVVLLLSSSKFFVLWLMMELNTVGFIILLHSFSHFKSLSTSKYFIVQSVSSVFLLMLVILFQFTSSSQYVIFFFVLVLAVKLGLPPFHFWVLSLMMNLKTTGIILLSTLQKIPALFIMSKFNLLLVKIFIMSTVGICMLNLFYQKIFNQFIGYLVILSSAWSLAALTNFNLVLFYIFVFALALWVFLKTSEKIFFSIKAEMILPTILYKYYVFLITAGLSLSGVPPTVGFFIKFMVLMSLKDLPEISFFLLGSSPVVLYVILRAIMSSLMLLNQSSNFFSNNYFNSYFMGVSLFLVVGFFIFI